MKSRILMAVVVTAGLAGTSSSRAQESSQSVVAPPAWVQDAICRPVFQTTQGRLAAGTAFVARTWSNNRFLAVLVTAQHLFGPNGGLARQVPWKELPGVVRSVRCARFQPGRPVLSAGSPLAVPGARPNAQAGAARDVAVFRLGDDAKADTLEIRKERVHRGQRVWLLAQVAGGEPADKLLHPGTIVTVGHERIEIEYDNPGLDLRATSGAPFVDAQGRVIGINAGIMQSEHKLFGVAQSAVVVRGAIDRALAAAK